MNRLRRRLPLTLPSHTPRRPARMSAVLMTRLLMLSSQVRVILSLSHIFFLQILTLPSTESEKSTTQKMGDSTRSTADSAQNDSKGMMQSAQETAGNMAGAAADKLKAAGQYFLVCSMYWTCLTQLQVITSLARPMRRLPRSSPGSSNPTFPRLRSDR